MDAAVSTKARARRFSFGGSSALLRLLRPRFLSDMGCVEDMGLGFAFVSGALPLATSPTF